MERNQVDDDSSKKKKKSSIGCKRNGRTRHLLRAIESDESVCSVREEEWNCENANATKEFWKVEETECKKFYKLRIFRGS